MLIELMPVIAKILLPVGTYEEKVQLREQIEKELTRNNHQRELSLKEIYNQTAFEQDATFIKEFFTASQKAQIVEAIRTAEHRTSGEVRVFVES